MLETFRENFTLNKHILLAQTTAFLGPLNPIPVHVNPVFSSSLPGKVSSDIAHTAI